MCGIFREKTKGKPASHGYSSSKSWALVVLLFISRDFGLGFYVVRY